MKPPLLTRFRFLGVAVISFLIAVSQVSAAADPGDQEPTSVIKCEGETAVLSCADGMVINVLQANYGRFTVSVCNPESDPELQTDCANSKTLPILKEKCENSTACNFDVTSEIFGDSCPGVPKYIEVHFGCVVPPTTTTTTTTPAPTTPARNQVDFGENSSKERLPKEHGHGSGKTISTPSTTTTTPAPKFCPSTYARHVRWPRTPAGELARIRCPAGTKGHSEWRCSPEGTWHPPAGPDLSGCISEWTEALLTTVLRETKSPDVQLAAVKSIHSHIDGQALVGGDLLTVQRILEAVAENAADIADTATTTADTWQRAANLTNYFVRSLNEILGSNQAPAWGDLPKRHLVAASLLDSSEKLMAAMFPVNSPALASPAEPFVAKPHVLAEASTVNVYPYVRFPAKFPGLDSVDLPQEALKASGFRDTAQVIYANFDGFQKYLDGPMMGQGAKQVVSKIISVSLVRQARPQQVHRLTKPVVLTFHTSPSSNLTNPRCVWWDRTQDDWSTYGCSLQSHNASLTVCECSHLTHFAVIMDVRGIELPLSDLVLLRLITYAGCTLSIICLAIAFLAFLFVSDSACDRSWIHMHLCLCLLIAEAVFLLGIHRTDNSLVCSTVAGLLQYFFLAAFAWMLLEGFQLYYLLVQVFPSKRPSRMVFFVVGYILPAIVVGASVYLNPSGYGTPNYCWLTTNDYFVLTFVAPVAVVLVVNVAFLCMTLCIVCRHTNVGYKPCKHDTNTVQTVSMYLKGSFALVTVLGLTWTLGFFWLDQKTTWVAYVFTVLNSLQGVFILLFHVVFNDKMASDYHQFLRRNSWLPDCIREPALTSSTGATSSPQRCGMYPTAGSTVTSAGNCSDAMYPGQHWTLEMPHKAATAAMMAPNSARIYNASLNEAMAGGGYPMPLVVQRNSEEPYDYATIPYDDMIAQMAGRMTPYYAAGNAMHHHHHHAHVPISTVPRHPFDANPALWRHSSYAYAPGLQMQGPGVAPPSFKPPTPPPLLAAAAAATAGVKTSPGMSDDSAYSDSGVSASRSPNNNIAGNGNGLSRGGTILLRMDLTKDNPLIWRDVPE